MKRAKYELYFLNRNSIFMSRYFPIVVVVSSTNNISNSVIWYQILSIQLSPSTIIIPTLEEINGTILTLVFVNTSNYLIEVFARGPCSNVISNLLLVFIESKILKYLTVLVHLSVLRCKKKTHFISFETKDSIFSKCVQELLKH